MTSVVCCRTDWAMVRLRDWAVVRLTMRSNVVGCSTGRSAGLAPFRILSIAARTVAACEIPHRPTASHSGSSQPVRSWLTGYLYLVKADLRGLAVLDEVSRIRLCRCHMANTPRRPHVRG